MFIVQVAPAPPGRRFPVLRIDDLRCPAYLLELRIARPGPPLGELLDDRMVHRSDELQEDDRTPAFEASRQLDPREPSIAGALAAQVRKCPICRVKRAYPRDDGSLRGPQRHRPVTHPAWHPPPSGPHGQNLAVRQRLPGQAGNGRKACTQFRHGSTLPARECARQRINAAAIHRRPGRPRRWKLMRTDTNQPRSLWRRTYGPAGAAAARVASVMRSRRPYGAPGRLLPDRWNIGPVRGRPGPAQSSPGPARTGEPATASSRSPQCRGWRTGQAHELSPQLRATQRHMVMSSPGISW